MHKSAWILRSKSTVKRRVPHMRWCPLCHLLGTETHGIQGSIHIETVKQKEIQGTSRNNRNMRETILKLFLFIIPVFVPFFISFFPHCRAYSPSLFPFFIFFLYFHLLFYCLFFFPLFFPIFHPNFLSYLPSLFSSPILLPCFPSLLSSLFSFRIFCPIFLPHFLPHFPSLVSSQFSFHMFFPVSLPKFLPYYYYYYYYYYILLLLSFFFYPILVPYLIVPSLFSFLFSLLIMLPQQYFLPSFLTHFPSVFRPYFLLPSLPAQERVGELQLGSSMAWNRPKVLQYIIHRNWNTCWDTRILEY